MADWYEKIASDMGYTPTWCKEETTHEKVDREEVLKALRIIKTICIKNSDCEKCPLRSVNINERCGVTEEVPEFWEIAQEVHWSAFI